MRALVAIGLVACSAPEPRELPGVELVAHGSRTQLVAEACGVDLAFGTTPTPTVRYRYTYNERAQISRVTGRFEDIGPDDVIDYTYDDAGHATSTIQTRGEGYDVRTELATYGAHGALSTFTLDQRGLGYHAVTNFTFDATTMTVALPDTPAQHYTLAFDSAARVTAAVRDDGERTTYDYDEDARTVTIDGPIHGVIRYDEASRELGESWSDHRDVTYDYAGDRIAAITFRAGEPLAPVEIETPRYTCD